MAFQIDYGDVFEVVDDIVDFLDADLLDTIETFTNSQGFTLSDSLGNFVINLFEQVTNDSLTDSSLIDYWNAFNDLRDIDSLDDLWSLDSFNTVGELIDDINVEFFSNLTAFFDGFNLNYLDTLESAFSEIDLSFLDGFVDVVNDFDTGNDLLIALENEVLDSQALDDLSQFVQNLDDLVSFGSATAEQWLGGTLLDDRLRGGTDNDILLGLQGNDTLLAAQGDDLVNGGLGNDRIKGKKGADMLFGHAGRDLLKGGSGSDVIAGGLGRDVLLGNRGNDVFFLQPQTGIDKIRDFNPRKDKLHLLDGVEFTDLKLVEKGDRTLIRFGKGADYRGRLAWLDGVSPDQLTPQHFVTVDSSGVPA